MTGWRKIRTLGHEGLGERAVYLRTVRHQLRPQPCEPMPGDYDPPCFAMVRWEEAASHHSPQVSGSTLEDAGKKRQAKRLRRKHLVYTQPLPTRRPDTLAQSWPGLILTG